MTALTKEAAAVAWRRAEEERRFWEVHRGTYLELYPNQFVAAKNGAVVATGETLDAVIGGLQRQGLEPTDVWLEYINALPGSTLF